MKQSKKSVTKIQNNIHNSDNKIKFKFPKSILNLFIGYSLYPDTSKVSKMDLSNLYKLLKMTDERSYEFDVSMYARLELAKKILEARIEKGLYSFDAIMSYCNIENDVENNKLINNINSFTNLTESEIKYITRAVTDRLQYAFILLYKEIILNEFLKIDTGEFTSYKEVVSEVKEQCAQLLNDIRKADAATMKKSFSLKEGIFEELVTSAVSSITDPGTALVTGVQMLNDMLSPGYMPGRLYIWLGISGSFKSLMLLMSCYWIKKYNKIETTKTPTVLYITTENSIDESIIRLFNMSTTCGDIRQYLPEEVAGMMRNSGGLTLDDGDTDIVMQYYNNFEISTGDIYNIVDDLEDNNREVIAVVVDYIKRIRSISPTIDERIRLANVSNELKDLSVNLKIPVITAQQINRAGNMALDNASETGKEDLARFLGRGNIAQCWDIIENSDWCGILNIEVEKSSYIKYRTVKEIKKRYKSMTNITYFNQPFVDVDSIQMVEDVGWSTPAGKISLATNLNIVDNSMVNSTRGDKSAKPREDVAKKKKYSDEFKFDLAI